MGSPDALPELPKTKEDGTPFSRIEYETALRDSVKKIQWLRILAHRELGLPQRQAWDMTEIMVRHWIIDEQIRRGVVLGDIIGVNAQTYQDEGEVRQFTQRLGAFIQTGHALMPKQGEGVDMSNFTPPPGGMPMPPTNGQPQPTQYAIPPAPVGAPTAPPGFTPPQPQSFVPPQPPAYVPPQPQAQQPQPVAPPQQQTYQPPAMPPGPPGAPQGFGPPPQPGVPQPPQAPPTTAVAPAAGGRRKRGAGAEAAPQPAAPVPPMQQSVPFPGQQQAQPPAPMPAQAAYAPPQAQQGGADVAQLQAEVADLRNIVSQMSNLLLGLGKQSTMTSMGVAILLRAKYQSPGTADIEGILRELKQTIPQ